LLTGHHGLWPTAKNDSQALSDPMPVMDKLTQFHARGPFYIPHWKYPNGARRVDRECGVELFDSLPRLRSRAGCYVFCLSRGEKHTPYYVGKATKGFAREVFTPHKLNHFNTILAEHKGWPTLFLVVLPKGKVQVPFRKIDRLEQFLITRGVVVNPDLANQKGAKRIPRWSIHGVLRSNAGQPSAAAKSLKQMFDL